LTRMKPVLAVAVGLCAGGLAGLSAQTLQVSPSQVLMDEPAVISATGLQPGERVAVRAELTDGAGVQWTSQADFIADGQGAVDVSKQAPKDGSYKEVSAMGLIWSMLPRDKKIAGYSGMRGGAPQTIQFALMRNTQQVSSATLQQIVVADGIQRIPVRDNDVRGLLFLPNTKERRPAVVVLGGSEGGMPLARASWLADRGYVALALAYFRLQDLPQKLEGIPLEYFQQALSWLVQRPEVLPDQIAVMGSSRGGELALQLGSMFPVIHAVVAYVPANVRYPACCGNTDVPYAWTWKGMPLAFARPRPSDPLEMSRAEIEVEKTHGPILMISAEDDHVWNSAQMADEVVARLKRNHFAYGFENLKYPHAGHSAGRPEIVPMWLGDTRQPVSGQEMELGGSPKGDAESTLDAIPKVLAFLRQNLPGIPAQQ